MIVLKKYQEEAVDSLLTNTYKLLKKPMYRHTMVLKAPTGSGKTVMMAAFLNKLCEEIPDRLELPKREVAFVWIAPNKLHLQSYFSLKNYFSELRSIKPIQFEDITDNALKPNEVLFVNWESINKEKNVMVRETETGKSLYRYVDGARLNDVEIVVIIDEEHMFANTKTAKRTAEVLQNIYPKIEIRVSATPITQTDYKTVVERADVVEQEMIKEGIILNPALDSYVQNNRSLNQALIDIALEKRNQLAEAYKRLGKDINPLLLIQLPNDTTEDSSVEDKKIIDEVTQYLEFCCDITTQNAKLAIWLSKRKENLENLEEYNNITQVLLFKQAIALGWDCPRAAVLLIFRELHSQTFTIQTVGRILRMPEQVHYPDSLLNQGYVYTNLSKNQIEVVQDDMTYITTNKAIRKEQYTSVNLTSTYYNTRLVRNRLGSKFRRALYNVAERFWGFTRDLDNDDFYMRNRNVLESRMIVTDVSKIEVIIPENIFLTGEIQIERVEQTARFAKTEGELNTLFRQFCRAHVGGYAVVDSTPILEMGLRLLFEEYLNFNEFETNKIILYEYNQPQFVELISLAIEEFSRMQEAKAKTAIKDKQTYPWEVPAERFYNEQYTEKDKPAHALIPFYENVRVSFPEVRFAEYLESNKEHLEWWYKNGESAKEHFAVPYIDYTGKESLFYVDFILLTKTGVRCLFDTKTEGSDPANAHLKHNALVEYIESMNAKGISTIGGIIILKESGGVETWRYCRNRITNTLDFTGWDFFNLATS
ncbi:MAG TPA: DEAD/DEAH box helicase family protein [Paludibacter sp.]